MRIEKLLQGIDYSVVQSAEHMSAEETGNMEITAVEHDSRKKISEGGLFICLRGLTFDGHRYIEDAARYGAAAVLTDRDPDKEGYPPGLTVLRVDDTRICFSRIAANFYGCPADSLRLFGVTGTNGKTSVTHFIEAILSTTKNEETALIGTLGVHVGGIQVDIPFDTSTTPDPMELQQILAHVRDNGGKNVVMEVSSHALMLHKLEGLTFEAGVFTNLTQDHLDFHGTMENYLEAKAKLFRQCRLGIINADDPHTEKIMALSNCNWITYGIENDCDLRAVHIEQLSEGSSFCVEIDGVEEHFIVPVKGRFSIYNALAAIGTALSAGLSIEKIREGLAGFRGVPGRIQSIPNKLNAHILLDYAHTPDGLANIISAVRGFSTGKVITLFGCGGDRDKTKRPVMGRIAGELSDYCIVTSDNPRSEKPEDIIAQIETGLKDTSITYEIITDRREAIFKGVAMLQSGDSLIIAGKGHERTQIIGNASIVFDDMEVAKEALASVSGM